MVNNASSVRTASADDLQPVLDVHVAHGSRRAGPASTLEIETWARMMRTGDLNVHVAEVAGEIVGTATSIAMPNVTYGCAPSLFIEAVVVTPERRRNGLGTALLTRILLDARAAGCQKVQLLSHKRHAEDGAHALYAKVGFEPEAEGFRLYLK